MRHSPTTIARWAAILTVLALLAGSAGAAAPTEPGEPPAGPIIEPGSWSDTLDDTQGLSWLEHTYQANGRIALSELEVLSDDVVEVWALTEGSDDKFYMGAGTAHLWSYDPATGETAHLGAPVPAECET
jgi:hypothetical protein